MSVAKNILIITLGETPQVVTETVWALLSRDAPFVPDEIHLVTTDNGRAKCKGLIGGTDSELAQLFRFHNLNPVEPQVHLPRDGLGRELRDVRNEAENIAFANTLTRLVKHFASDPRTCIHVSLAGGRKTMSYYAGVAISLFGRDQDELTHVLVEPAEFEHCRDFFWPHQKQPTITTANGRALDAKNARIIMVSSPFIRLRGLLRDEAFSGDDVDYAKVVEALQANLDERCVKLRVDSRTVSVGRYHVQLPHLEFAFYLLLANAMLENWPGAGPEGIGKGHFGWLTFDLLLDPNKRPLTRFLAIYQDTFGREISRFETFKSELLAALDPHDTRGLDGAKARFSQIKAKAWKKIANGVGHIGIRNAVNIATSEDRGPSRFGLLLEPNQIEIVPRQ